MKLGEGEKTRDLGPVADGDAAGVPDETGAAPQSEANASVMPRKLESLDASVWPVIEGDRYNVAGEHARGGLGRILEAIDRRLDRPVALKELLNVDHRAEARFVREALVTARLQHPSIVPIHEVGRWPSGEPFYTMKMVQGRSLGEVMRDKRSLEERLSLLPNVIAVADAVAYAHSQRVIHRDLKPSNVLIGPFGETVVIDWGLASDLSEAEKLPAESAISPYRIATSGLTVAGTVMGTPEYMPPEQARGDAVDERADVYAIGAILYHLLAGSPPYRGETSEDVLAALTARAPEPLEQRQPGIPEDLLAIVRKAMARDATARYPTAAELADDLKRFQTGQLVGAHQYSSRELLYRWIRRHRAQVSLAAIFMVVLATTAFISVRRIIRERNAAEDSRNELILVQARTALDRDPTAAIAWLKTYPRSGKNWSAVRDTALDAESRGVAHHVLRGYATFGSISPDGQLIASSGEDNNVVIWSALSGKELRSHKHGGQAFKVEFSPNGRDLLIINWQSPALHLWNIEAGGFHTLTGHTNVVLAATFSQDGTLIVSGDTDGTVQLWDQERNHRILARHAGPILQVLLSPDSSMVASTAEDHTLMLCLIRHGSCFSFHNRANRTGTMSFSHNGMILASTGENDSSVWLMSLSDQHVYARLDGHKGKITQIAFSPDDGYLATASMDKTVRLWDLRTQTSHVLEGHRGMVKALAFSPDAAMLASGDTQGSIRVWEMDGLWDSRELQGHHLEIYRLRFLPSGRGLVSWSEDKTLRVWDITSVANTRFQGHRDNIQHVTFSRDGKYLASSSRDKTVHLVEVRGGAPRVLVGHRDLVIKAAFSPDGRWLASASFDKTVRLWRLSTGESFVLEGTDSLVWDVAFSPDGRLLAAVDGNGRLILWQIESSSHSVEVLASHQGEARCVVFSPDSRLIATTGADHRVRVWDVATETSQVLAGHQDLVYRALFTRDGERLFSASWDHTIRVWNLRTNTTVVLEGHRGRIRSIALSPDEKTLASGAEDNTVRLWNLADGSSRVLWGHGDEVRQVAFSPTGTEVASASWDDTVRVWDVASCLPIAVLRHFKNLMTLSYSPDGQYLAYAGVGPLVHLRHTPSLLPISPSSDWLDTISSSVEIPVSNGSFMIGTNGRQYAQ